MLTSSSTVLAHPGHVVATASAGTVALRVLLLVGAAVLAGTAVSSRRWWTLPLLSLPVLLAGAGTSGWSAVAVAAHVAAASVWLGAVVRVVWSRQWSGMGPLAVSSAVTVAVTGAALAVADRVRLDAYLFDRLVLLKAGLLLVAVVLGLRRWRVELVPLVAAAAIGAALIAVPTAPKAGVPVAGAAGDVPVTVVPQRPGSNLVHVDTDDPVTVNGVRSQALPGATGQWVRLHLPAGRSEFDLGSIGRALVDTGHGPARAVDGPECASALLQGATACPSGHLDDADAAALSALGSWLTQRGLRYAVRGDASPRSLAAEKVLAAGNRPTALVLTGTWESAATELARIGRTAPSGGVYLAPWLLTGPLLSTYAVAAPLAVLPFDPKGEQARAYVAGLPAGEQPSPAGFRAWGGRDTAPRVWATSPASIFPKSLSHDHGSATGWFPGGALVPVADLHPDGSRERAIWRSME